MKEPQGHLALQLTSILLVVCLLPVLIHFAVSYQNTRSTVLQVASQHHMEILAAQTEYLELQMEQIDALAANLGQVDEINAALASANLAAPSNSYDALATQARIGYLLSNYRNLKGLVSIDVFSLGGAHYHVGDTLSQSDERTDLRDRMFQRTLTSGSSVVWHGVEDNILRYSSSAKVLVASKVLLRPNASWLKADPVGMLVVNYSTDHLHERFSQLPLGQGAYMLVLDDRQRLIYSPNRADIGQPVPEGFARLLTGAQGSSVQRIGPQDMLLSYQQMPGKNWYVVSLVPKDNLLAPMATIQRTGLMLLLFSVVMVVLFIRLFASRVVQPIGAIAQGFQRFQQSQLPPGWRMPLPRSLPEIRDLVQWFNAFLDGNARRNEAETRLRIAATAFESQEGMFVTDAERVILQVNTAFTRLTGYSAAEAVGQTPRFLASGRHDTTFYSALYQQLADKATWAGEIYNAHKDGTVFPVWLAITGVKDEHDTVTHFVATMVDITQRKADEEAIRHLAFYDALTALPNRRLLNDRLRQAMADCARRHTHAALMLLDLDKFKVINDTLGHGMGDLLLAKVAQRLVSCVREGDTVARLGGDEFVVLLEGLGPGSEEAARQATTVGQKMIDALNTAHDLDGVPFQTTASFGVTVFANAQTSVDELMKQADIAMYQAKDAGRNTLRFFDPAMHTAVVARAALEAELRLALAQQQFRLYYQPVFRGDTVRGAEVLLRWAHLEQGMVPPAEFIPLAEETGLIVSLGLWVLEGACQCLVRWAAQPALADLVLSVNVSPRQFRQADFVPQVLRVLHATGANPARIKLEITESLLVDNVDDVVEKMHQLIARGVQFSLDDFGTGYSSLAYLKRMPLSEIKIDHTFVRDLLVDPSDAITVRTILALGQSMGLAVVAEGVETEGHRDFLVAHGCELFQGYLYSKPLTEDDLDAFLHTRLG